MAERARVISIKAKAKANRPRHKAQHYQDRAVHMDVDISEGELVVLRKLVEWESPEEIAHSIGCSQQTLFRVCGGFLEHCRPETRRKFRAFFGERKGK